MPRFPKPLHAGDLIAVTAPSSGVPRPAMARLEVVLSYVRSQGYRVIEGECLRGQHKDASAPAAQRAHELMRFLTDPAVSAIMPPWGGELAIELLGLMDFEGLRSVSPKWLLGYSDLSTLQLPLTIISGWATAHGPCLMDLVPTQTDPLATSALRVLSADFSRPIAQDASTHHQKEWMDFEMHADAPLHLTEPTCWKRLDGSAVPTDFRGRLLGGCLDTIAPLAGSPYGDVPGFVRESGNAGAILYLENAEMSPTGLVRTLWGLRLNGWFENLSGLMLGRSTGPVPEKAGSLTYEEALWAVLADLPYPVLYDVDIGHKPPQFTLINGAMAQVTLEAGRGRITQGR